MAIVLLAEVGPAASQTGGPSTTPSAPAGAEVSTTDLQKLLDTLQNDQDRAKLTEQLRALIATQHNEIQATPPASSHFLDTLSDQLHSISTDILATVSVVIDAPRVLSWIEGQASDEGARSRWEQVLWHLLIVFALASAADLLVRRLLTRPRIGLTGRSSVRLALRLALSALRILIDLLPIFAFAAVALFALQLSGPRPETERVTEVAVYAILIARGILVVAHELLLSPSSPAALLKTSEETRNYLYIWARRFVIWTVYGYAVAGASWWLGVPGGVYVTLLKSAALVLAVLAIVFVLQNRRTVSAWLRGSVEEPTALGRRSGWWVLRQRLSDTWHILAIVYVLGLFAVYALHIPGGFTFVLRASVLSILLIVAATLLARVTAGLSRRGFAVNADLRQRFPTLEARANRYLPVLSIFCSAVIYFFTMFALLQAWGFDAFRWFNSAVGRTVAGSTLSIGAIVVAALLIWELFNSAVERYIASDAESRGRYVVRSARIRTLVPLVRTTTATLLLVFAGLMILSELGLNIAPLLAGAGIVGLAIGFGSQALVKDVITGLFILIEDTLAVGDVVDVGSGHMGTVEGISVRSLKLRDMSGTVHTVPFSDVTTVQNLTRNYAYVVADIGVVFSEDTDHVMAVMEEVGVEMQQDPKLASSMMEPLEIVGVDRFTDSAVVIRARIKTRPLRQWELRREFNRRLKKAFDRNGIEMPAENQTRYLPETSRQADGATGSESPRVAAGARNQGGSTSRSRARSQSKGMTQ